MRLVHPNIVIIAAVLGVTGCRETKTGPGTELRTGPLPAEASEGDAEARPAFEPPTWTPVPDQPAATDVGIFDDLADKVVLRRPQWTRGVETIVDTGSDRFVFIDGVAVGLASPDAAPTTRATFSDLDGDLIPDQLDILIGAKKTVANGAPYKGGYRELAFPGGDVPRTEGVCTDVLIRALRNAGLDLQRELYDEIGRAPKAFPMVETRNPNIDQRRVKTLLPYFERRWTSLPTDSDDLTTWLPGDVVFMNTMGDKRPDHVGIVSDRLGRSGKPLIINNWTNGYQTTEMDIVDVAPVTHRFRPEQRLEIDDFELGVDGLLTRYGAGERASGSRQVVVVSVPGWDASEGLATRWERRAEGWREVGDPIDVTLGAKGVGIGRGVGARLAGRRWKVEGDRRAPVGVFELGKAFGRDHPGGDYPFEPTDESDSWVDDPALPSYNTWVDTPPDGSHERLSIYDLAVVVEHNTDEVAPGAGSAIFLHTWQGEPRPTLGCTAMARHDLVELVRWLDSDARPLLVQVVDRVH